jgi:hypothetical protein
MVYSIISYRAVNYKLLIISDQLFEIKSYLKGNLLRISMVVFKKVQNFFNSSKTIMLHKIISRGIKTENMDHEGVA